jgi:hypothetical protein
VRRGESGDALRGDPVPDLDAAVHRRGHVQLEDN